MKSPLAERSLSNIFVTAGQMGERIRDYIWSDSLLGPMSNWPQSLQSALSICLNSNFPIAIYWGQDLVLLYNDAWSPIPGNKHPWALGKPAIEVWPDIWNDIEPQFKKAFEGMPGGSRDALLLMQRHGYTEECYFDFTFTPIYGESGKVEGIFNAVIETTYRVINERRAGILQRLSDAINSVTSSAEVFQHGGSVLKNAKEDVPFYCIIEFDAKHKRRVQAFSEIETEYIDKWPVEDVLNGSIRHVESVAPFFSKVPQGDWPEIPSEALIIPLKGSDGHIFGCIIGGLSARRKLDKDYRSFYESIAAVIGGELNTIKSLDEQRDRAEALAQLDKAKTAFFSNISHEFRTPLTLMLAPLQNILEEDDLKPEVRENISISYRNTLRLQKLVNSLLDFSRVEAGKTDVKFQKVNLAKFTEELASSFRSVIESSGLRYEISIQEKLSTVLVDLEMWEKIVLNLISNAFKYTQAGVVRVELTQELNHAVLKISDTGVGIRQEDQLKIFERFYRVNHSEGRSQEGTGIGLSMVKELINLHKGEIHLLSEYGKGSTFIVTIPVAESDASKQPIISEYKSRDDLRNQFIQEALKWDGISDRHKDNGELGIEETTRARVLLADDNSDMRDYVQRLLQDDFEIRTVTNGEDALALALSWTPDVILSDIMMPKLDGYGLLKKLKEMLVTRSIPVIFLSARAGEQSTVEGITAGADDYLIKPFSSKELIARVTNQVLISKTRRQTEKEFYNLFLQSPAHIHVMKGPEHIIEFFHPLGKKFTGGRDITGMKMREALPEVEGQGYFEMLDQVYHEGKSFYLSESKVSLAGDDGNFQDHFFDITYLPFKDVDEKIQGVLQFTFDVTKQAKANQKIKESEERFRLLVSSIPQIIWIADTNGNIEFLSEQWERFTGVDIAEGMKKFSSFIHTDDIDLVRKRWFDSMRNKVPWKSEYRLKDIRTNEYRWFFGHTLPLLNDQGEVLKWIGSSSDIHAQKTANEQLEGIVAERTSELIALTKHLKISNDQLKRSNEDLQQFAHVTSHDLKEPVRKIKMYGNILKSDFSSYLPEKGSDYLNKIDRAVNRISAMIDGVLQYSSVEAFDQAFESIDINVIIESIQEDLEIILKESGASIKQDRLPVIKGSPTLIHQLFYNLINNSLKFRKDDRKPIITIQYRDATPEEKAKLNLSGDHVKIVLQDNGIGFEQIYAERIFESFARLNSKDRYEGTGLGLALCKKIVRRHGGCINATGMPDEGALFSIFFPKTILVN